MSSSDNRALERLWLQALARERANGTARLASPPVAVPDSVEARLALMIELSEATERPDWRLIQPQRIRGSNFRL